ncbi:YjdF family protein [Paraeggerthella hongkongensis]|uniref:DUF2992 domain-containing protein n=1 Tax=Paraeggerthella hongkongensis TaxID=230658 RepID=A0A3N0BJI9_9ACTN|nr:YjdF family protein [Paraeggerthella hongkongensis]RNL48090.1 DUF2992 domain-containing protein [Paraeggerthella hongkongensis]
MQISVSSTLTVYHDGQFWVGIVEHVEEGRLGVTRIVFGAEPSEGEILRFVASEWEALSFFGDARSDEPKLAKSPKRRQREASKALDKSAVSTKAQQVLADRREARKRAAVKLRKLKHDEEKRARFEQRSEKRKKKKRGH